MTPTSSIILLEPMETQLTRFLSSFPDLSELFSPPVVGFVTLNITVRSWDHSQRSHTGNFLSLVFRVNSCRRFLTLHSMVWEWFRSSAVLRVSSCQRATEMLLTSWSAPAEVSIMETPVTSTESPYVAPVWGAAIVHTEGGCITPRLVLDVDIRLDS